MTGSNVFWMSDYHPDGYGVAIGAFADVRFPAPARPVSEPHRHIWVQPPVADRFTEASGGARVTLDNPA